MRWITDCDLCNALRAELIWVIIFIITLLLLALDELSVVTYARPSYYPQRCIKPYHYYDQSSKSVVPGELEILFREQHQAIVTAKIRSPRFPEGVTVQTVNYRYNHAGDSLILYAPKPGMRYEAFDDRVLLNAREKAEGVMGRLRFHRLQGEVLVLRSAGGTLFHCVFL